MAGSLADHCIKQAAKARARWERTHTASPKILAENCCLQWGLCRDGTDWSRFVRRGRWAGQGEGSMKQKSECWNHRPVHGLGAGGRNTSGLEERTGVKTKELSAGVCCSWDTFSCWETRGYLMFDGWTSHQGGAAVLLCFIQELWSWNYALERDTNKPGGGNAWGIFFWFAFSSAVERQLQSLELVPVLQRSTTRSQILKYAWCNKVTLVSDAGAFEDLAYWFCF